MTSPGGWDLDIEDPSNVDEVDEENAAEHVEGMNKVMAHIGVRGIHLGLRRSVYSRCLYQYLCIKYKFLSVSSLQRFEELLMHHSLVLSVHLMRSLR